MTVSGAFTPSPDLILGFIGLGAMGGHMTRNLVKAGYRVVAYDLRSERLEACVAAGALAGRSAGDVAQRANVVLTSLPSSEAFVRVAEDDLVPNARAGQIFIDVGTVTPPETRRLARAFAAKEATLIDAPVSGGPRGAETGSLLVFAGGDEAAIERCRPIFQVLGGNGGRITYCGPAGCGQVVKGVNQLAMGLGAAAYLEAVAFGVNAGIDPAIIGEAVGGESGWRGLLTNTATRVAAGKGNEIGVKFRELP
ncbi:MAG: NAD(P)-dependent oxidoreductase [Chloroflexi bacterium]|nr:NAD(P)-dependent oxidoreductase [Chloroflexota bacterium]